MMRHVTIPIGACFGLARVEAIGADVNLVLQQADGGLCVLAMSGPTALAIMAAIRADISAPIEDQHRAMGALPMGTWDERSPDPAEERPTPGATETPTVAIRLTHTKAAKLLDWIEATQRQIARQRTIIRWAFGLSVLTLGFVVFGIATGRL